MLLYRMVWKRWDSNGRDGVRTKRDRDGEKGLGSEDREGVRWMIAVRILVSRLVHDFLPCLTTFPTFDGK